VAAFAVLSLPVGGSLAALYALSPDLLVMGVMGAGWTAVIWATGYRPKWMRRTRDPAPPPHSERGSEEDAQFTVLEDPEQPGRHIVVWKEPRT